MSSGDSDTASLSGKSTALLQSIVESMGGGELREGQQQMCEKVANSIEGRRHLIVEAGTGTGKSLGYLVPAITSGKKTVVVTSTKPLQDQLVGKDIPLLSKALGRVPRVAAIKGKSNYLCLHRFEKLLGGFKKEQESLPSEGDSGKSKKPREDLGAIGEWAASSPDGDRSGIPFYVSDDLWEDVSVDGRTCPGAAACPSGSSCFAEAAKHKAAAADIIVTNTALYALHAVAEIGSIPNHDIVVIDEAHKFPEAVTNASGTQVSSGRFTALAKAMKSAGFADDVIGGLKSAAETMAGELRKWQDGIPVPLPRSLVNTVHLCESRLATASRAIEGIGDEDVGEKLIVASRLLASLKEDLYSVCRPNPGDPIWVDSSGRHPSWKTCSADIGFILKRRLWPGVKGVLTSATIQDNLPDMLGLSQEDCDRVTVDSPFDYENAGLLYLPRERDLPPPTDPSWASRAHLLISRLTSVAGGRTLALFTSYKQMTAAAETVRARTGLTVYTQNDLPTAELIRRFTDDPAACLFATMKMWEGVDVPGPSLSLLIVDKLPFARKGDPIIEARRRLYGVNSFNGVVLPEVSAKLAQGVGRLIRSSSDRGVAAILDTRLTTGRYGSYLLGGLPPFTRTNNIERVEGFLADIRLTAEAA